MGRSSQARKEKQAAPAGANIKHEAGNESTSALPPRSPMMNGSTPRFTVDPSFQAQYRAPTLQQPANLQALFRSGKVVMGTNLSYPSRHVAKTIAVTGADWCWIDAEHVAWSPAELVECIQVIIHESGGKMVPVVRVPSRTAFDYMAWCLDAGAGGIIVPHLETAEEMKKVIAACRFPPIGHRSFPPFTFIPGVTDITPQGDNVFSLANRHIAIVPQIETRVGLQNLEEIVKLEDVAAFMIGSGDLRMEMNLAATMDGEEPEFVQAMEKAKKISRQLDVPLLGVALGPELIRKRLNQGFRILVVCMDLHTLAYGVIRSLSEARGVVEEHMQKSTST